jgi:Ni,Fe-hydrogenase maturation factor
MKILVFGNPLVKEDSLALKLLPKLKETLPQHEFIDVDPTEDLDKYGKQLVIIDSIINIKEPRIIEISDIMDFNKLSLPKVTSMHDFDLSYNLKLLMQAGKINSVKIIGLPWNMEEEGALEWVKERIEAKR